MTNMLNIETITKKYDGFTIDIDLEVSKGEFLSLLGPSGCGKTTLLRLISGLENPDSGRILLDGVDITRVDPSRRGIGLVFQDYALFPHLSVKDNILYGLVRKGIPQPDRLGRLSGLLDLVGLYGLENRDVATLSGGEKQRVALARSIAIEPKILLLDEPFSALDPSLRVSLRREINGIIKRLGMTTLFVTHNPEEALSMSDRIAVMNNGKIVQLDSPINLYNNPLDAFTASFTGSSNSIDVRVVGAEGNCWTVSADTGRYRTHSARKWDIGESASLIFRPERVRLVKLDDSYINDHINSSNIFEGTVYDYEYLGSFIRYVVNTALGPIKVNMISDEISFATGEPVVALIPPEHCILCGKVDQ